MSGDTARCGTLRVDSLLADRGVEIMICCGSGGVGKTTTSAALALRAAEQGRRVVVLTIDPARRLAQSLGLTELDNSPREVAGVDASAGGRLDAMMLDMKRTFDEVVTAHASPAKAEQILGNPFYQALSTSFSGTQEYMAMEKLGQLHQQATEQRKWDLIVVDTPPSRSALDFLEAPEHLSRLLDGRMLRMLLAPARGPFKLMSVTVNVVMGAMDKILGAQVLRDVQTFVNAFDALFGGFRQRAEATLANLSSAHTRFLVVASPTRDALREAAYFTDRLREEGMPLAGVVVNRVHGSTVDLSADRASAMAEELAGTPVEQANRPTDTPVEQADRPTDTPVERADRPTDTPVERAERVETRISRIALQRHADRMRQQNRERRLIRRFGVANPEVPLAEIPAQLGDVNDLAALRAVGGALAEQG